jgi:hypothetical protein
MRFAAYSLILRRVDVFRSAFAPNLPALPVDADRAGRRRRFSGPVMAVVAALAAAAYFVLDLWSIFTGGPVSLVLAPITMIVAMFLGLVATRET